MKSVLTVFALLAFGLAPASLGQTPQSSEPSRSPQQRGIISGTVVDQSGAVVSGARVRLSDGQSPGQPNHEMLSDSAGQFSFPDIAAGVFQITVTFRGFSPQTVSGVLHPGEIETLPLITLSVANTITEVQVRLSQVEVAEEQIKAQEKQRVLGVLPNFYVSYVHDAAPLSSKQKYKLALRTMIDPFTFVMVGGAAGIEQAQNHFAEYGQGAEGYAKRFGAGYADMVSRTFIGSALLPALLKQDPRYFYKGTGRVTSRFFYAIGNAIICRGDNGLWQANYSNILGNMAAGAISNAYYPEQDRNGVGLTLENGAIGIGSTAIANLFQEFVVRKLTPRLPKHSAKP